MREDFAPYAEKVQRGLEADAMRQDGLAMLVKYGMTVNDVKGYMNDGYSLDAIVDMAADCIEAGEPVADQTDLPTLLSAISAADLQRKNIPPIRWIVQDLIPAGLSILASPPKFGKSWMAMHLCLTVAMGRKFLGYQCCKTKCLYLALEDSERRLKSRMDKLLMGESAPAGFDFVTEALTLDTGLIDALEAYITRNSSTGLIIVDTLQKIRSIGGRDVYGKDYADIGVLKRFADTHNIAVLLIHHLRKAGDDSDPFARISGTNGLSGAADTMLVLAKERRNDENAKLSVTGRDVEQNELVVRFDRSNCLWENLGDADAFAEQQARKEYLKNPIVRTVKKLLEQSPDGWSGNAQQLMDAGQFITHLRLASTPRDLTGKFKQLDSLLFENDSIIHERKTNGSGGGKHKFYYADTQDSEKHPDQDKLF